jgi:transposase
MGMSWKTTTPNNEREAFIAEYQSENFGVAELARRFGISRKTAYKWLDRFKEEGWVGLADQSRAPNCHPNAMEETVEHAVLEMKARWPRWGAPKILIKLRIELGDRRCPSESSISRVLKRHGLVRSQAGRPGNSLAGLRWAQRDLVRRLQRVVCHGRWSHLHTINDYRRVQPISVALPRTDRGDWGLDRETALRGDHA